MTRWIYVSLPWATFALEIRSGRIVDAPPIARKFIGHNERDVALYYRHLGARFVDLP